MWISLHDIKYLNEIFPSHELWENVHKASGKCVLHNIVGNDNTRLYVSFFFLTNNILIFMMKKAVKS